MSDFKAKMHQIRFRLWAPPQTPMGELTALPQTLAGFKGPSFEGRGREGEGEWKRREGEGKGKERGGEVKGREGKGLSPLSEIRNTPLHSRAPFVRRNDLEWLKITPDHHQKSYWFFSCTEAYASENFILKIAHNYESCSLIDTQRDRWMNKWWFY